MITKDFKETVRTRVKKKELTNCVEMGREFAKVFKIFCTAEGRESYSRMKETKAALRTIGCMKSNLHGHMDDYGLKNNRKMPQNLTTLSSMKTCLRDLIPKNVMESDFSFILKRKAPREDRKPRFKIRDRIGILKQF